VNISVIYFIIRYWKKKCNVVWIWIEINVLCAMKIPRCIHIYPTAALSSTNSRCYGAYSVPGLLRGSFSITVDSVKQTYWKKNHSKLHLVHHNSQMVWLEINRCLPSHTLKVNCLSHVKTTLELRWLFPIHRLRYSAVQSRSVCCKINHVLLYSEIIALSSYIHSKENGKYMAV
jgi:hypothetical protein